MATPRGHPTQPPEEIDRTIRQSLINRKTVRVSYDDGERVVCPYMIGRNREGRVRVLCLQLAGTSATGLEQRAGAGDWRCLALEKISRVDPLALPWRVAESAVQRPKCIDHVELAADAGVGA